MPFDPLERSASLGRPEELYEFTSGTQVWRYTSADRPRLLNNFLYEPARRLRRTRLKQDKDGGDDSISITVPGDLDVAWAFRVVTPARPMWVKIFRRHRGDGENFFQSWHGRVRGCAWNAEGQAVLEGDGLNSMFKRSGLRLDFDTKCPHMLYDPGCSLDKDNWRVSGDLLEWGKNFIRSPAFATVPDQWLKLGYVEFGNYNHMIIDHVGDRVTTFHGIEVDPNIGVPLTVAAYAGCDRSIELCWTKFDNGLNSEANPWMPKKNPFESGL